MAEKDFYNLDVVITKAADGYLAHIVNSPEERQAQTHFSLPFTDIEAQEWLLTFRNPRHGSGEMDKAKSFGGPLFEAIFGHPDMMHVLRSSAEHADRENRGLRIRLRMNDTPELAELPWEYMYNAAKDAFFVLSSETPIVRFIELSDRTTPLRVEPPMNVLVVIAAPTDQVQLDTDNEWAKINEALGELIEAGKVTVDRLPDGRLQTFTEALTRKPYHVIHFIGHGEFDKSTGDGTLLFEDGNRKADRVPADMLAQLLADKDSVRLMVLNACEGAFGAGTTIFAGTAQSLVRKGVPGLVAMQFKISDQAAIIFSKTFYDLVARGFPLDTALAEARRNIYTMRNNIEWGTPILFVRAKETKLFTNPTEEAKMADEAKKDDEQQGGVSQSISIGGSVGGDMSVAGGDINNTVDNSKSYTVGDISASGGNVVIGEGNTVTSSTTYAESGQPDPFIQAQALLATLELPGFKEREAESALENLQEMRDEGEVEHDAVDYYLSKLEEFAPPVAEALITALTNPGAAVGKGLAIAIKAYRDSRKA